MNRKTIGRISTIALLLGTATVACTPNGHVASASDNAAPRDMKKAQQQADAAKAAIAAHKAPAAITSAEKAVALAPNNADYRMLLGQAYLSSGRFASAETAFRDTLQLSPAQPRASFNLALVEIAQNKPAAARQTLETIRGRVPDSDLGLALALAGDHEGGIALLTEIVRAGKSDARSRQNLALAFALAGRWNEARGVAMQDTTPDRINDQIAGWAELAKPGQAGRQVAAMLGTVPAASDPGLPAQLALAAPTAADPVAVALAAPEAAAPIAPVATAPASVVTAPVVTAPVVTAPVVQAAAAPAPVRQVAMTLETPAAAPAPAAVPAMLAAPEASAPIAGGAVASPPPLIRASAKPVRVAAAKSVAPAPELVAVRQGGFVVQLGAFAREGAIDAAWAGATRLTPNVVRFTPVKGSTSLSGATLVRISVGGFKTRADAQALCTQLRGRGQACFVRGLGNDAPMQWVRKDNGKEYQLAAMTPARAVPAKPVTRA